MTLNRGNQSLTEHVAEFITTTRYGDIRPEMALRAKKAILNTIGVALAGAKAEGSSIIRRYIQGLGCGTGAATVFGTGMRVMPRFAALANAGAMHADDFDDTFNPTRVHSSSPVLAAVFAEAEHTGASGRDLLTAFGVGTEVTCKVSQCIDGQHYKRGYHATSTCGVFGATAGLCNLLRLPLDSTLMALGIAGSEAMGLRENLGTMVKPWHAGRAAESAVLAVSLVKLGFTATRTILEGPLGFFMAAGGGYDDGVIRGKLGNPWCYESPGVAIKPFPSGRLSHPAMCKLQELVVAHDIKPDQVERLGVRTNRLLPLNLTYHRPTTGLQGKFSMEFGLAAILTMRRAELAEFTDAIVNRADVRQTIDKIDYTVYSDEEAAANGYALLTTFLDIALKDGRRFSERADTAYGSSEMPMNEEQISGKFRACAEFAGWRVQRTEKLIETILRLDELEDVQTLAELLQSEA